MSLVRWMSGVSVVALAALSALGARPARAAVQDTVNAGDAPTGMTYGSTDVGWMYTPSFSYVLTGIETRFGDIGPIGTRTVTAEIFDGLPKDGGTQLRSADFTASTSFAGGTFSDLLLTSGHSYFVGFRHVDTLGASFTADPGAVSLGAIYFDELGNGSYKESFPLAPYIQPILQFDGHSVVPEPGSLALLGTGILPLLGFLRRRRGC